MKIGKLEILTREELKRRLRVKEKAGYRTAIFQLTDAKHILFGREALLRNCKINGKVVLMGDDLIIAGNTIKAADVGIRCM